MIEQEYFTNLYKQDIDNTINLLRRKFNIINYEYYHNLIKNFPLNNNGYIEFSLTLDVIPKIRFFFVYYDDTQKWINKNLGYILENNLDVKQYKKIKQAIAIFKNIDNDGLFTYGADITSSYFKLYFVSTKLNSGLKKIGRLFNFPVNDLEHFDMIGLNIYKDKIDVKLYLIYNFPSKDELFKHYKPIHELEHWDKYTSSIETFISILPQYNYQSSIAFPTLFNINCKKKLQNIPQSKGIFLNSNIYPTWIGFNEKAKLQTIYFRPKRDYILKKDNVDIVFKDKDYKDYKNEGNR